MPHRGILVAIVLVTTAASVLAQERKPGWLLQTVEARARDVENAVAIVAEGRQLYGADETKLSWDRYCKDALELAFRGEFREAVRASTKAFFLGESQGSDLARASASRDMAMAFSFAGDLEKAWYWTEQAHAFSRGAGTWRTSILALVHGTRGSIQHRRGAYEHAIQEYEKALDNTLRPSRPYVLLHIARAEHKRGNPRKAAEIFAKLLQDETNPIFRSAALRGQAEIALATGNARDAKRLYIEALKDVDDNRVPLSTMWFRLGLARAMLALDERAAAAVELETAVQLAEGIAARFRSEEFRTGFFGDVQEIYELALEIAMDEGRHAAAFELSEMSRARAFADLIRGRINHPGAISERVLRADAIAKTLPDATALIAYHVLPKRTAVWVLRRDAEPIGQWLPLGTEQLAEATRALRQQITEFRPELDQTQALYKQLIEPLNLKDNEAVVLVPHRTLHFLPFAALRGPKGWFIEERAVAMVPSASSLAAIVAKPSIPADSLLAMGNPTLIAGDLPPLPGAENEVKSVASHFAKASTYVREAATKVRLLADSPANSVLHVAAHAQVDDIDPMYSRIRLAASGTGKGDLEAHELYRVNFGDVRVVALSACDSGLGRVSGGDEFWGFKRTVLGAGARTLIASLWPVVDESTPILMARFYESLKKMSGAESLRAGQLELIRSKQFGHPLFWAPFMLVGDWR